jgi:HK97 gp10 family phage protein
MISNEIDFEGLIKKIRDLPVRAGRNAGRRALRKGANVIRDAARINARAIDDPETREQIFKNISVSGGGSRRERRMGGPMMRVGIRGGARHRKGDGLDGLPGGNTTHWRWIEFGFTHDRSGRPIPAQPFMRKAMSEKANAALSAVATDLPKQLDKELAKLGQK